jgi:tRNA(Ile)-lysidine synthase
MASTRKSNLLESVAARLAPLVPSHSRILLGLSGGADSVVLLHLLHQLAPRFQWQLSALHVHHGISPNADAWSIFCMNLCVRYAIPLHIEHVDISSLREIHGVESAARQLRQAAFAKQACDVIALAHHADDQSETLMLQLLRGAGVKGLAAMPVLSLSKRPFQNSLKPLQAPLAATLRPLLDVPRARLLEYAAQQELQWVEDESNADAHYPRNFLRHQVFPVLQQKFPNYREVLARSASHLAEANQLLDELAQLDAGTAHDEQSLAVDALRVLSHARAKNLLRYFLHAQGAPMPQLVQIDEMLKQLCGASGDAAVCVSFGDWQVRRYQGRAYVMRALREFDANLSLHWSGENEFAWPALTSRVCFTQATGEGISLDKLQGEPITLRHRTGGETLRPHSRSPNRSLKNVLQEHLVPPWQRERLPLLYCGEVLVSIVGVAIHTDFQAQVGHSSLLVSLE